MGGSSGIFSYNHSRMTSSDDEDEIDLESGELELKVHSKSERICRICHLDFSDSVNDGCIVSVIACSSHVNESDLNRIKTCEICGATAHNVGGEHTNDTSNAIETEPAERTGTGFTPVLTETRTFWQELYIFVSTEVYGCPEVSEFNVTYPVLLCVQDQNNMPKFCITKQFNSLVNVAPDVLTADIPA
ncbi:zinc finger, RING-CH-type, Zinc finger, RING/FYVE/PHD-type [Artemisia annua]|uniref:Zinc finger, RING-CH-type, Zinc finger, RING/FYVE/PHD-type n=1 Tax=Artemisia annua TaxID=35608 RepID=A0A2U1P817_ARTAN|nr:zinc finger, RING-CH-type, Zinc finger, RING/FYVE/PHD-type [Artemisia annua]